jgi:hypothetical protein
MFRSRFPEAQLYQLAQWSISTIAALPKISSRSIHAHQAYWKAYDLGAKIEIRLDADTPWYSC